MSVSGKKRPEHAESNIKYCHKKVSLQTDEQRQATLAKQREAYQKEKACETEEQRHVKCAKERENY